MQAHKPVWLLSDIMLGRYIRCDFNHCQRRFKFVGKIIYEIFLDFCQEFLTVKIKQADGQPYPATEKRATLLTIQKFISPRIY
jgi:hypothetical protein